MLVPHRASPKDRRFRPAIAVWIAALVAGFSALHAYENRPGEPGTAAPAWPSAASLEPSADKPTVLVFAHPQCPCTAATMEELDRLVARVGAEAGLVHVLFYCPDDEPASFADTSLRHHAERIPGVQIQLDRGGRLAKLFGAKTSGQVLVYEPTGSLRFRGGITGSRGHVGSNRGSKSAEVLLGTDPGDASAAVIRCPVFGCPLTETLDESEAGS